VTTNGITKGRTYDPPRGGVALVTGASSGIGLEFARRLAADGWNLVLVSRDVVRLSVLASELQVEHGIVAEVLVADLTEPEALAIVETRLRESPAIGLLVNNAGFGTAGPFVGVDITREERLVRLNVIAPIRLARAVLPAMATRGSGAVINVASELGLRTAPMMAVYGGSKAFMVGFTRALEVELAGTGVQLQALCPGLTKTRFAAVAGTVAPRCRLGPRNRSRVVAERPPSRTTHFDSDCPEAMAGADDRSAGEAASGLLAQPLGVPTKSTNRTRSARTCEKESRQAQPTRRQLAGWRRVYRANIRRGPRSSRLNTGSSTETPAASVRELIRSSSGCSAPPSCGRPISGRPNSRSMSTRRNDEIISAAGRASQGRLVAFTHTDDHNT
jgi:uncharacterized protein